MHEVCDTGKVELLLVNVEPCDVGNRYIIYHICDTDNVWRSRFMLQGKYYTRYVLHRKRAGKEMGCTGNVLRKKCVFGNCRDALFGATHTCTSKNYLNFPSLSNVPCPEEYVRTSH